jgi:hypothetical protein
MKKIYILALGFIAFFSCTKPTFDYEVIMNAPILSSSVDSVRLLQLNDANEAVSFSWTSGTNYKTNAAISYTLKIARQEDKFSNAFTFDIGKEKLSKSFKVSELNSLLVDSLHFPVDTLTILDVKVVSTILSNPVQYDSTNIITLKVIPYKYVPITTGPDYTRLWIVGNATPNGWNIDNPNEMTVDPTDAFQFKYNEVLNAGEFKIPTAKGNWNGDFFMPPTNHPQLNNTAVQLTRGGHPDNKWEITTPGAYKILLNISSSPFISITPFTPYTKLWIVGDATPAGWNIGSPTPMVQTAGNPYEFTYTGPLTAGEFKIPTATGNWGTDYYMPFTNAPALSETTVKIIPGGNPDNKWKITVAGNYKITLNQLHETINIQKL